MPKKSFPKYFLIQTVSLCNAGCIICPYVHTADEQPQGHMNNLLFTKIIDEAAEHAADVVQIMPYLMNEPFMDKDIVGKICYFHQKLPKVYSHLVTNGILINESIGASLINSPLTSIKISMLAHRKKTYEKVMGISGFDPIFEQIVSFAELARRKREKNFIMISCTVTPGRISSKEIEEARQFWTERDIQYEVIIHPASRAGNLPNIPSPTNKKIRGCNSIWWDEMIHILFNGDVVLCCMDWRRQIVLGNIQKQSIEEIWNSEYYQSVRKMIKGEISADPEFLCYHCEVAKV
ncbi:radical SAM/SPASM domain-containing protein [Candidatus Omnitrophota bacterium]